MKVTIRADVTCPSCGTDLRALPATPIGMLRCEQCGRIQDFRMWLRIRAVEPADPEPGATA